MNHALSEQDAATFGPLPVNPSIARSLRTVGYSQPTPVQERAIPVLRQGKDVLAQAQTGTGKTAAFGIPLIEAINPAQRGIQVIILVPTRELCMQVADELSRLGANSGVRVVAVYGGVGMNRQIDGIRHGAQILVGTPGRVEDLIGRGLLRLDGVRFAILDEADRMLDVGFLPPIERILGLTPKARQTALFSATLPDEVLGLARRHTREPVTVAINPEKPTVEAIDQRFQRVENQDKLGALCSYLDDPSVYLALIFRRTTHRVDRTARDLSRRGYKVGALHGRRTQQQRERVLRDLKSGKLQALVATDIAARGLDIEGLTHVFNLDLPDTPETYVHRIGRTGRAGETGTAITFHTAEEDKDLLALQRHLDGRKNPQRPPSQGSGGRPPRRHQPRQVSRTSQRGPRTR